MIIWDLSATLSERKRLKQTDRPLTFVQVEKGRLLLEGIRQKLFTLPDDTLVYSGHGPVTTTGHEKRTNPIAGVGA